MILRQALIKIEKDANLLLKCNRVVFQICI